MDVHATADRELVVIHDATVDGTIDGHGRIDEMTLEQIKPLDAAHWFVPSCGTCHGNPEESYAYRGYATGKRPLPRRLARTFSPNDFRIPTLCEVLETFPDVLINIEIKATARTRSRTRRSWPRFSRSSAVPPTRSWCPSWTTPWSGSSSSPRTSAPLRGPARRRRSGPAARGRSPELRIPGTTLSRCRWCSRASPW
jgi:hypothetical protein